MSNSQNSIHDKFFKQFKSVGTQFMQYYGPTINFYFFDVLPNLFKQSNNVKHMAKLIAKSSNNNSNGGVGDRQIQVQQEYSSRTINNTISYSNNNNNNKPIAEIRYPFIPKYLIIDDVSSSSSTNHNHNDSQDIHNRPMSLKDARQQIQKLSKKLLDAQKINQLQVTLIQNQVRKIEQSERYGSVMSQQYHQMYDRVGELKKTVQELEERHVYGLKLIGDTQAARTKIQSQYHVLSMERDQYLTMMLHERDKVADLLNKLNEQEQQLEEKAKNINEKEFMLKKRQEDIIKKSKQLQNPHSKSISQGFSGLMGSIIGKKKDNNHNETILEPPPPTYPSYQQTVNMNSGQVQRPDRNPLPTNPIKKLYKFHDRKVYSLSTNFNGNLFVSCADDNLVKVYDLACQQKIATIPSQSVESIFLTAIMSYDGQKVLVGCTDKKVVMYDSKTGRLNRTFLGHNQKINTVVWSALKNNFLSGSDDKQIKLWDVQRGSNISSILCQKSVKIMKGTHNDSVVYSGHADSSVRIYSPKQTDNKPVSIVNNVYNCAITSITLVSQRAQVIVGCAEGISLVDFRMNGKIESYNHNEFYNAQPQSDLSPNGKAVIIGDSKGQLFLWHLGNNQQRLLMNSNNRYDSNKVYNASLATRASGHQTAVTAITTNINSGIVISADKQGSIIVWE